MIEKSTLDAAREVAVVLSTLIEAGYLSGPELRAEVEESVGHLALLVLELCDEVERLSDDEEPRVRDIGPISATWGHA